MTSTEATTHFRSAPTVNAFIIELRDDKTTRMQLTVLGAVGFFVWFMFSFYSCTLHRFVHVKIVQKVRWHLAQLMNDNLILIKFI